MHLLHSRHTWFYRVDFDLMIDFCIWTLQVDGLQVPPFDQHLEGDGSLRTAGLTAEDWQSWLWHVISQQDEQHHSRQQRAPGDSATPLMNRSSLWLPEPRYPFAAWSGNDAVRERLTGLWEQYGPISDQRKRREREFGMALLKAERTSGKRLYDELRPYATRLPPLAIYLVEYEQPLDYLVPPATLLMTLQEGQPSSEEYRERVLAAVEELAAQPGRRGRKSLYSRVGGKASQFIPVYRTQRRKPVPPAPPKQELPALEDPVRQMVFADLSNRSADLTTVQFLREKNRPGWRFYELTFQEIDGEQHRMIYILRQKGDGSWRYDSAGSSSDMQNQWSKIFAPVHDHPLLFLGVQAGGSSDHQHFLRAYGDVIDNGFHVERVRLVTRAGQIFEDRVEDGYVFFACEQQQPIPLPMQAELYNNEGKLVWRQTVPDHGLPPWLKVRQR